MARTHAFTLIELMVVIAIIAVLAGMIIGLIGPLRQRVKIADTQVRMNAVHQGMALIGQNEGSATFRLQQLTEYTSPSTPPDIEPGLGGVFTFGAPTSTAPGIPTIGKRPAPRQTEDYGEWGYRGRGHLAYPWGKKFPAPTSGATVTTSLMGPERFLLRHMSPFNTRKLLKIANILPTRQSTPDFWQTEYMTNRKASEPWNDAWGHPLVVAATLYQPTYSGRAESPAPTVPGWRDGAWPTPPNNTTAVSLSAPPTPSSSYLPTQGLPSSPPARNSAAEALVEHYKLYQYNRSVYIAVAAVGPVSRVPETALRSTTLTDWANSATNPRTGHLNKLWAQANWVCQQAKENPFDKDWSELSFDNPMWQGNKYDYLTPAKVLQDANRTETGDAESGYQTYTNKEEHCLLSAPLEYR